MAKTRRTFTKSVGAISRLAAGVITAQARARPQPVGEGMLAPTPIGAYTAAYLLPIASLPRLPRPMSGCTVITSGPLVLPAMMALLATVS